MHPNYICILNGIPHFLFTFSSPFSAGRYHSLVIDKDSFPSEELEITAWTEDGLIMAARHKKYNHLQVRCFFSTSTYMMQGKGMFIFAGNDEAAQFIGLGKCPYIITSQTQVCG